MKATLKFATLLASLTLANAALAETLRFVGTDGNWFNPRNWSGGHVPGRGDDVVIGSGKHVVVTPVGSSGMSAGKVVFQDIHIAEGGSVETLAGTSWTTRNEFILGRLIHRSTDASTDLGGIGFYASQDNGTDPGLTLNPTPKSKRIVVLQSSVAIVLGGTEAAGSGKVGRGYYANLNAETAIVAGSLEIETKYGFLPKAGDVFRILRADRVLGMYRGLPEGAMVKRIGNIGLFIHYTTREHILLARQVG